MSSKTEFERALLALDRNKLYEFCEGVIAMYVEYVEVHGHTHESAVNAGIMEVIGGTEAMVELDDHGEL